MKNGCIFIMVLASCSFAHGQMYKCIEPGVKVSYSDMPCSGGTTIKATSLKYQKSWQDRLKLQRPPGISIVDILTKAGKTSIEYTFKKTSQSNQFMRLIDKLSSQNVALMNMKQPKGKVSGRGQIEVSNNTVGL